MQAAQDQLKTAQLKDSLDAKISHRPSPDELANKGILPGAGGNAHELHASVAKTLEEKIQHRPPPEEVINEGILDKSENPKEA